MYSQLYQKILFPAYEELIRQRNTVRYLKEMEASQWLPPEIIAEIQWNKLKKLLGHAWENVPYYRQVMEKLELSPTEIRCWEDFQKIPTLNRETIRENYQDLIARNYQDKVLKKSTGGSTGEPLHFAYTRESHERRMAAAGRAYSWAGCLDGERTFYLWGGSIGREPWTQVLKRMAHNAILRRRMFNCLALTQGVMEDCLRRMNRFRPKFIVGYTTPLFNLAEFIKRQGKEVIRPRAVLVAAEKLFSHQRRLLEDTFQCQVFETYGSREFMNIASECDQHQGLHLNAENLLVEFLKDGKKVAEGDIGEIVITDLHNYGMPFIRYKIGDLGVPSGRSCPCDRGLPLMAGVEGRLLDTIQTPEGRLVSGEFFPRLMRHVPEVIKYQVVQEDIGNLEVSFVIEQGSHARVQDFIRPEIEKVMGKEIKVEFRFPADIEPTASGKFRVVVSKVPKNFGN